MIDSLIVQISKSFTLTDEGEVAKYLRVDVKRNDDNGSIELWQPFLIQRLVEMLELDPAKLHNIPAVNPLLHKDLDRK